MIVDSWVALQTALNRNGLVAETRLTLVTGTAEREAAEQIAAVMAERNKRATLGANRAYGKCTIVL
jgi:hypothetical protein